MSQLEPYLPDNRVLDVQQRLYDEFPVLDDYNTDFVTTRIEPPWYGVLPDGTTGRTNQPVVQFVVVSDHPRPVQRKHGVRHGTTVVAWQQAFEEAEKERKHYVSGKAMSAEERIFRLALAQHLKEMDSLKSIMN